MALLESLQRSLKTFNRGRRPRQARTSQPQLEFLEDRTTPTILFTPQQAAPSVDYRGVNGAGQLMGDANPVVIYPIFWGSWWSSHPNCANAITTAIDKIFSQTTYLQGDGGASTGTGLGRYLHKPWALRDVNPTTGANIQTFDTSDPKPTTGYWLTQVGNVVENAIDSGKLGEPDDGFFGQGADPIYVVFTAPGVMPSSSWGTGTRSFRDTGGFLDSDTAYYAWVSTQSLAGNANFLNIDYTTKILCREIVGTMTDADAWGWSDQYNRDIASGEAINYTARISNSSYDVQAYWSLNDQAYVIPDRSIAGPSIQKFTVNNHQLTVNGGQIPTLYPKDSITIDTNFLGGVDVNLNGEHASFDPGVVTSIVVNTVSGGGSVVWVKNDSVPVTINPHTNDTVTIGGNAILGMTGVTGNIKFGNTGAFNLKLDDSGNLGQARQVLVTPTMVLGLPTTVFFQANQLKSLEIDGGSAGNQFILSNTPCPVQLYTGLNKNEVDVLATSGTLDIYGQSGINKVFLGGGKANGNEDNWDLSAIHGQVYLHAQTGGSTALTVGYNSFLNSATSLPGWQPQVLNVSGVNSITGLLATQAWMGLVPHSILFDSQYMTALTIIGGGGAHGFIVANTPQNKWSNLTTTFYCPVNSPDGVVVQATTGALTIQNAGAISLGNAGSAQSIKGKVTVLATPVGTTKTVNGITSVVLSQPYYTLTVDDSADATMTTMYLNVSGGNCALTGNLAGAEINFANGWVKSLTVKGGTNTDNFYLYSTPTSYAGPKYTSTLVLGNNTNFVGIFATAGGLQVQTPNGGTDTVWVCWSTALLSNIQGWIDLSGKAFINLVVEDDKDTTPTTYSVTTSQVTWQQGTSAPMGVTYGNLKRPGPNGTMLQGPAAVYFWHTLPDQLKKDPNVLFPVSW